MRRSTTAAACGALLLLAAAGCNDFLTGPGIDQDPNNITRLDQPGPLYIGVQTAQATQFEGQLSRLAGMYTQQIAGVARQGQGYDLYQSQPTDLDPYWIGVYTSGGLVDIRRIQQLSMASGDSTFAGIAKVWEAFVMGMAASFWGDIPYSEALQYNESQNPTLVKAGFDSQTEVYETVQKQLDSAIVFLSKTGVTNVGPRTAELIYAGRSAAQLRAVYTEVAHTLKARFYLHRAEADPSNYALAAAEARLGISTPANDFNFYHGTETTENNVHHQFYTGRGDVLPGAALVNLMKSRIQSGKDVNIDRLGFYFFDTEGESGDDPELFCGYRPGGNSNLPGGPGDEDFCDFAYISSVPDFRQPMITFAETKLILAEACLQSGCEAEAQSALDAVRENQVYGATSEGPVVFESQPSVPATLQNVMEQKYIDLFLNPEVWNDYKRTCLPYLAPAPSNLNSAEPGQEIAGRVPYGLSEFSTNEANIPNVTSTGRNANDPQGCARLTYTSNPRAY